MFAPFAQAAPQAVVAGGPAAAAFASAPRWPADLGAEVVCSVVDSDGATKSFKNHFSGVPMVSALSRRCSYEEVVHHDDMEREEPGAGCPEQRFENMTLDQCLQTVTQWAVTLRDVLEDRGGTGLLRVTNPGVGSTNCVCRKAQMIVEQLERLEKSFAKVLESSDAVGFEKLWSALSQMKETLRMNVSIQASNITPFSWVTTRLRLKLRELFRTGIYMSTISLLKVNKF